MKTFSNIFLILAAFALFAGLTGATHQLFVALLCGIVGITCRATYIAEHHNRR